LSTTGTLTGVEQETVDYTIGGCHGRQALEIDARQFELCLYLRDCRAGLLQ